MKKLYTRADARAEMARAFDTTKEARAVLHRAALEIRRIGKESGFENDAERLLESLQARCTDAVGAPKPHGARDVASTDFVFKRLDGNTYEALMVRGSLTTISRVQAGMKLNAEELQAVRRALPTAKIRVI